MRMNTKTLPAYAKINLYLDVNGKRADGYHDITTVMQTVSLSDTVTVTRYDPEADERVISVSCSAPHIPTDKRNIVWKCAEAFFAYYRISTYHIAIDLIKQIPSEAGLGGGSSDGAAVLKLLNDLFEVNASSAELSLIGAGAGADIPFCVYGGTCLCTGLGEHVTPLDIPCPGYSVLIAFPEDSGVSTAAAYRLVDDIKGPAPFEADKLIHELESGSFPTYLYNRFEAAVCPVRTKIGQLCRELSELGAGAVLMSGSGCAVYGLFDKDTVRDHAESVLRKKGVPVFPCRPV